MFAKNLLVYTQNNHFTRDCTVAGIKYTQYNITPPRAAHHTHMVNIYRLNQACMKRRRNIKKCFVQFYLDFIVTFFPSKECYWFEIIGETLIFLSFHAHTNIFFFKKNWFWYVRYMYAHRAYIMYERMIVSVRMECIVHVYVWVRVCVVNILCAINPLFTLINR